MGFAEALSDDGSLTGRGLPWMRGLIEGIMTTLGGVGHTLPFLIGDFRLAMLIAMPIIGRLYNYVSPRILVGFGVTLLAIAYWKLGHFSLYVGFWSFLPILLMTGVGMGASMVTTSTVSLTTMPRAQMTSASSLLTLTRRVSGNVAYATLAGLPPEYGLYCAMVPTAIAALFGSSLHAVSGPTNAVSLMVLAMLTPLATYTITKATLPAVSRELAMECVADGIRPNTSSPGAVDTPMHANDDHEQLKMLSPARRLVQVSEIVDALLYLESAPMVNGENIRIDGGAHAGAKW